MDYLPEFATLLLTCALITSLFHASTLFFNYSPRIKRDSLAIFTVQTSALGTAGAFLILLYSFATSDFSVRLVFENSHTLKPILYKLTGTWGNHEGSMLLFLSMIAMLNFVYCRFSNYTHKHQVLAVQSSIFSLLLIYVLVASNPFVRIFPTPEDGQGLNPLLQDIGLAFHPPMLYSGYVGTSLAFSYAIIGLLSKKIDATWAKSLRVTVLTSFSLLTLGIVLGSWWAYRELGWGGYWFWDPVENTSLLPWLSLLALFHALMVLEKRGFFASWAALLAITAFALSLIGFFLVRSGVLTSVHSFASDPARGVFMLGIIAIIIGSAFVVFMRRAPTLKTKPTDFNIVSKEGLLLWNNLLLMLLASIVLLGTLYPIITEIIFNTHVSVGAPYFSKLFTPIAIVLLALAVIAPSIAWKKIGKSSMSTKLSFAVIALMVGVYSYFIAYKYPFIALFGTSICAWLMLDMLLRAIRLWRGVMKNTPLPIRETGMILAHFGAGLMGLAITMLTCQATELEITMKKQEVVAFGHYNITFLGTEVTTENNYITRRALFSADKDFGIPVTLEPEYRVYFAEGSTTVESAIHHDGLSNLYIVAGDGYAESGVAVRIYQKPFINAVWLGAFLMSLGAAIPALVKSKKPKN